MNTLTWVLFYLAFTTWLSYFRALKFCDKVEAGEDGGQFLEETRALMGWNKEEALRSYRRIALLSGWFVVPMGLARMVFYSIVRIILGSSKK